jgi:hypothetical protein
MGRYHLWGFAHDGMGKRIDEANVTVYQAGTTNLVTIYEADSGGTAVTGSVVQSGTDGYWECYIEEDTYAGHQKFKVIISKENFRSVTIDDIEISRYNRIAASNVDAATSGTGEDDLRSLTYPGGLIATTGAIRILAAFSITDTNDGNKTIKFYFGTDTITIVSAADHPSETWMVEVFIEVNNPGSLQRMMWRANSPSTCTGGYGTGTTDTSANVTVKFTGECADAGDLITQNMMSMERVA